MIRLLLLFVFVFTTSASADTPHPRSCTSVTESYVVDYLATTEYGLNPDITVYTYKQYLHIVIKTDNIREGDTRVCVDLLNWIASNVKEEDELCLKPITSNVGRRLPNCRYSHKGKLYTSNLLITP